VRVTFHLLATLAIDSNFGMLGDISNKITHATFCDNRFTGFRVLIPPILPLFIGMAGALKAV